MARDGMTGADDDVFGGIEPASPDTYGQVKDRLGKLVADLAARGVTRLPPEDQLSIQLHVSRPTVRSALLALQKEGKIQRVHGRGTFINVYAARMTANLAEDAPFLELLAARGVKATVRTLALGVEKLDAAIAERLECQTGCEAFVVRRLFEADGDPAVLSVDFVPTARIARPEADVEEGISTFDFVRRNTRGRVRYSVADLIPVVPDGPTTKTLSLPKGTAVLMLDHLHIGDDEKPIAVTKAYVRDDHLRFSIVRIYGD